MRETLGWILKKDWTNCVQSVEPVNSAKLAQDRSLVCNFGDRFWKKKWSLHINFLQKPVLETAIIMLLEVQIKTSKLFWSKKRKKKEN